MSKFESIWEDFRKSLKRLEEVLKEEKTEIVRDSAIKRFEIAFDLAWKTVKAYLEDQHNLTCVSPQSCLREAFRVGLIDYDDYWMEITKARNLTVHTYNEILAERIYNELPHVIVTFKNLDTKIEREIRDKV
ncbi:MAG: HI0074 family nucleotidyltransferase substrate-binding subunit [Nitrospirota bacterium]